MKLYIINASSFRSISLAIVISQLSYLQYIQQGKMTCKKIKIKNGNNAIFGI